MKLSKIILTVFLSIIYTIGNCQKLHYSLNLKEIKSDQLNVQLDCPKIEAQNIIFYFPKTVPGTYAQLDYGRYIKKLSAHGENGKKLKVERIDVNSFKILEANHLKTIKYTVEDTWDKKEKKNKIFEPAGSGFEKDKYFVINGGALFGCFDHMENTPYTIDFTKKEQLVGYSSLTKQIKGNTTTFVSSSYHELIDCPILFTTQKAEHLTIGNCKLNIASYYVGDSASYFVKKATESSFKAIEQFTGELPVKNYDLLLFIEDQTKAGKMLKSGDLGVLKLIRVRRMLKGKDYGALEHGTSSLYFLPDFMNNSYKGMVNNFVTHEFMHIYTPLNLHSSLIGDFNYRNPKMSKHLWLYEGITEYFSVLIQMQGGIKNIDDILQKDIRNKIISAQNYPDSIPFTEMSANVFKEPYKDLYDHVYDRGAIMGMLLDFEIMHLTQGKKTLKDIVFSLSKKYGENKSFDENTFISNFVNEVHPDLQYFFDKYVEGTHALDIEGGFKMVGVNYKKEKKGLIPINILSEEDNDVKANKNIVINNKISVTKVGKKDIVGFIKGDKVDLTELKECFKDKNGNYVPEGTNISITVIRKKKEVKLSFPAKFKNGSLFNFIEIEKNMTEEQKKLWDIWTKNSSNKK